MALSQRKVLILTLCLILVSPRLIKGFWNPSLQIPLQYRDIKLDDARAQDSERRGLLGEANMRIYGSVLKRGYYYVPLRLGTPPQDFALIVDTGSTVTYVPCSTCTHCGNHTDPRFTPASSSSYQPLGCMDRECESRQCDPANQCRYQRHYAEMSSTSGLVATDVIGFFAYHTLGSPRVMFGCELIETGDLFTQQADGITGLGRGHFSIVTQMANQGAMEDMFSLCYGGMEKGNGMMVLGADEVPPDMQFTPFDSTRERSPYYSLVIQGMSVGGNALTLASTAFQNGYGAVLDSGTTFTYLPSPVWTQFEKEVLTETKLPRVAGADPKYPDICFSGAGEDLTEVAKHFPTVSFQMGGWQGGTWSLELAPENFLFKHSRVPGAYCLGIFENQDAGSLIGGISVRNMLVRYDRENNRFGFARRDCADLLNSKPTPSAPVPVPVPPSETEPETAGAVAPVAVDSPPSLDPSLPDATELPLEAPAVVEACATCPVGEIRVSMELPVDIRTWDGLRQIFVDDLSAQLQVSTSQVEIASVEQLPDPPGGLVIDTRIRPGPGLAAFEGGAEKRIVGSLERNEVDLPNVFGEYNVRTIQRVPAAEEAAQNTATKSAGNNTGRTVGILAGVAVLLSVVGFFGYRTWKKRNAAKYVTMEQIDQGEGELRVLRHSETEDLESADT